jgi:hypothetical protein
VRVEWGQVERGRVWHLLHNDRPMCGTRRPVKVLVPKLAPIGAVLCDGCDDAVQDLGASVTSSRDRTRARAAETEALPDPPTVDPDEE